MKIVIAGAGSVGRSVALELLDHGHECTLIDNQPDKLRVASVADADWVLADACSPDALADAGLADADVMVAATGDDKANLVISLLAKTEFAVPRVVSRLNNPKNEWLFDASWGVDVSVSTPRIMTALVEEAVSVGIPVRLFSFNSAAVSMYAIVLPEGSAVAGRRISEVDLPPRTVLTSLLRDGRPLTPSSDDLFETGDELLLLVSDVERSALDALQRIVAAPEAEISEAEGADADSSEA
ncbi:potassium channel family protein [Actinomyces culturomici]|uniref:potassium channel family protein n=1 Tax=Actinomyces culturomici TaxID=1926276 RepID=UPI000E1FF796|nr:TrkA family potassium uptake protein [Actinomyces culturomici]